MDNSEDTIHTEYDRLNRYVIEIIKQDNGNRIRNTYKNLVSNIGGVLSKYSGIENTSSGIIIRHMSGSRFSWVCEVELTNQNSDSLYITKWKKVCSFGKKEKSLELYYENLSLNKFSINDSIKANCNCDNYWNELMEHN
ncbi:hypothetical protein AB9P05_21005 [Roseivirga sp. BDSF3-8]|uniref:hypothetical protein n=1 Tax=Roseivirga sp. BDSF3-8 TaxID=3241598 RepID=UPI003531C542